MNVLKGLLRSRKVWLAIVGVIQTVVFTLLPDFPPEIWQAINVLLLAVIAGIAIEDAAEKLNGGKVRILPMVDALGADMEAKPHRMKTPPVEDCCHTEGPGSVRCV